MSASKDTKRGTWKVYIRYIDWMGNKQIKTKRGFQTKKEALAWEREFLQSQSKDMNMSFKAFAEIYMNDMKPRIGESTMENKRYPDFLCEEIQDFIASLYGITPNMRIFNVTKSYLHHEMDRGCKESGVKRIRIHDLRHSHAAHLIELGFSPVAIAERLGHKGISITYMYAHLYPSKQYELAEKLSEDRTRASEKINLTGDDENV